MGTREQCETGIVRIRSASVPGRPLKLGGESFLRVHQQFQSRPLAFLTRRYYERMTLQEGRKTDRWYPQVDVLSCFDFQLAVDRKAYFEPAANSGDQCSWEVSPKHVIPI